MDQNLSTESTYLILVHLEKTYLGPRSNNLKLFVRIFFEVYNVYVLAFFCFSRSQRQSTLLNTVIQGYSAFNRRKQYYYTTCMWPCCSSKLVTCIGRNHRFLQTGCPLYSVLSNSGPYRETSYANLIVSIVGHLLLNQDIISYYSLINQAITCMIILKNRVFTKVCLTSRVMVFFNRLNNSDGRYFITATGTSIF